MTTCYCPDCGEPIEFVSPETWRDRVECGCGATLRLVTDCDVTESGYGPLCYRLEEWGDD